MIYYKEVKFKNINGVAMLLNQIYKCDEKIEVKGISLHAGQVEEGYIFFAIVGTQRDGHDFIDEAIKRGASVIVHSKDVKKRAGVFYIKVDDVVESMNQMIKKFFLNPSENMYVIGITGTNGKTSTAQIIYQLSRDFEKSAYLGTLGAEFGNVKVKTKLTTLDAISLNEIVSEMRDESVEMLAMEVSSHGLSFRRVDSIDVDLAIFTNLTQDHLDYYKTMENYKKSKVRLFEGKLGLINIDDEHYEDFEKACHKAYTYGKNKRADYRIKDVRISSEGSHFTLEYQSKTYPIHTKLRAEYNIYNLVAAIGALHIKGRDLEDILMQIEKVKTIEGRMDFVKNQRGLNIFIDYAHTPDGLDKVLSYVRDITPRDKELIAVFGSAGQRDALKRPIMGQVADKYCNKIILTEEDSRDEDIYKIMKEIEEGIEVAEVISEPDRYLAIKTAIKEAQEGDTIIILGKGSEQSIEIKNRDLLWLGDENAVKDILKGE